MNKCQHRARSGMLACVAIGAMALTAMAHAQATPLTEVVLYGIDADTHELLRYTFDTDTFVRISEVVDQNGFTIDHPECLTYIPAGPHKGFYAVSNGTDGTGGPAHRLAKITGVDGFTVRCYMYSNEIQPNYVRGIVSLQDTSGDWLLYAAAGDDDEASIITIDPVTGLGTPVMSTDSEELEGLAGHSEQGKMYGINKEDLFEIDYVGPDAGLTLLWSYPQWRRMEALESVFGEGDPAVEIPGVDPLWTLNGALIAFSDSENELLVFDPVTGGDYVLPCAFSAIDCEGLVFMNKMADPWGEALRNVYD